MIAESLDNAHLASRNPENASTSGGKPPDPTPKTIIKFDCFQCYRHSSQSNFCQIITGKDIKHVSKLEIKQLTLNHHLE